MFPIYRSLNTFFFVLFAVMIVRVYFGSSWKLSRGLNPFSRIGSSRLSSSSSSTSSASPLPIVNLFSYPDHRSLDNFYLFAGKVHHGYGRGSKKLGFPTANLPQFEEQLTATKLVNGVYYGLAQVESDKTVHYCVANIGYSPTFTGQENRQRIIEAHLIDYVPYITETGSSDFYDKKLQIVFLGFLRKEKKFSSIDELKQSIGQDVTITREIFEYLHTQGLLLSLQNQFFPESIGIAARN